MGKLQFDIAFSHAERALYSRHLVRIVGHPTTQALRSLSGCNEAQWQIS